MPIYEYQGQQYDISTTDPQEAKQKILKHLGTSSKEKPFLQQEGVLPELARVGTSVASDIGNMVVTAPNLLAGGLLNVVGAQEAGDDFFRRMEQTQEMITNNESRPQTLPGKVATGVAPVLGAVATGGGAIPTLVTAGFGNQGANLVKQGVDSNTASTVAGIDTGGNLLGAFVPGGRAVQAMANPAFGGFTDAINQKILQSNGYDKVAEQYDPTSIERRLTDAVTGAVLPPNLRPKETQEVKPTETPKPNVPPFDELAFVQTAKEKHQQSLEQLYGLQSVLTERINNGDASKEVVRALEDLDPQIEHHLKEIQRATEILEGKSSPDIAKQINKTHTQNEIKKQLLKDAPAGKQREARPDEYVPMPDEVPENWRETMNTDTGEIPTQSAKPKQSPIEVAASKIEEASLESPERVKYRLQSATAALNDLPNRMTRDDTPGSHYSALKEALETEIEAYQKLLGIEPTPKQEPSQEILRVQQELETAKQKKAPAKDLTALIKNADEVVRLENELARLKKEQQTGVGEVKQGTWVDPVKPETVAKTPVEDNTLYTREEYINKFGTEPKELHKPKDNTPVRDPYEHSEGKPEIAVAKIRRNIANIERNIQKLTEQLKGAEDGSLPSGSIDKGLTENRLRQFEYLLEQQNKALQFHINKLGPQETEFTKNVIKEEVAPVKYESVQDIINKNSASENDPTNTGQQIRGFIDNPSLFNTKTGTDIHFDKRLSTEISPKLEKMLSHLLNVTQLGKEKIYFVFDNSIKAGRASIVGNSVVVRINPERIAHYMQHLQKDGAIQKILGEGKIMDVLHDYTFMRIAAHEIGHVAVLKYLRDTVTHVDDLRKLEADWKERNNGKGLAISIVDKGHEKIRDQYQNSFHEFFSERVARNLMLKHVLGAFDNRSKGYLGELHKIINASVEYIRKRGVDLSKRDLADEILKDILNGTQEYIKSTGKEAEYRLTLLNNDKEILAHKAADPEAFPFYKKTLQETWEGHHAMGHLDMFHTAELAKKPLAEMKDPDPTPISMRAAVELGHGIARNFFGKVGVAKIFRDNPVIQKTYQEIRNAEIQANKIHNQLWYGKPVAGAWEKAKPWEKMSKLKDKASAYMQVKFATNEDAAVVHDLFKRGFEEQLEYSANKQQNGAHLTPKQSDLYDSLSKLFRSQYDEVVKIQEKLDKKKILPFREGWYPAVRNGQFYVDLSFGGTTLHRQHFRSQTEAKLFLKNLDPSRIKYLDISPVLKVGDDTPMSDLFGGIEMAQQMLIQKFPNAEGAIRKTLEDALTTVVKRGGKLGKHHQFRSNLSGYRGAELFASNAERGNSFKRAIQASVEDYSGGVRKMLITHNLDTYLNGVNSDKLDPISRKTAQQMMDSSLNRLDKNYMEHLDSFIREGWDKSKLLFTKSLSPTGSDSFDSVHGNVLEAFYLMKLMAKVTFPLSQVLGAAQGIREMSYDGGYIRPYISFAKGIGKLITNDADLRSVLEKVSQETNTFEPQFIEALHLGNHTGKAGKLWEGIKTYVFLNRVNESADSLSRVVSFSAFYDMYKSMGLSKEEAIRKAMDNTDSTMVPYGRTETAPIFNKLGITGQALKPLQTFGQQQLANWISDFRYMKATDPKTWAPMLNYSLVSTALGGVVGLMFVQEYEILRKFLEAHFPEYAPPSILDIAKFDPTFLDRVEVDPKMVKKGLLYGAASMTGIDVASSMRANETFFALVGAVATGAENWQKLFPVINFASTAASGAATLTRKAVGGNVSNAQTRQAISDALPSGAISYGAKELMGVNTTKVLDKETNTPMLAGGSQNLAIKPMETIDKVAGYMGTKSTEDKYRTDVSRRVEEQDKLRANTVKSLYTQFIEQPTGSEKSKEILQKLVTLGETSDSIKNNIGNEAFKRNVDVITRLYATKRGVASTPRNAQKMQQIFQFKSQNTQ